MRLFLNVILSLLVTSSLLAGTPAAAATATATINSISATGVGAPLGTVAFTDSATGLVITSRISGLPPGKHGFHIHEKGTCGPGMNQGKQAAGFAAGSHYDDFRRIAPAIKVAEIRGRSIMVHAGGDNYSDAPAPLGGGGARTACGVIE